MVAPARMRMLFGSAIVNEKCGETRMQTSSYLAEMTCESLISFT